MLIVTRLDVTEDIGLGQIMVFVGAILDAFFFQAPEEGSVIALSQQLPRRLMLGYKLLTFRKRNQSLLQYCEP